MFYLQFYQENKIESYEKLYYIIKQKYPNITSKHLNDIIASNIPHDIKAAIKHNYKYFNKIFSNHKHSYQMDILIYIPDDYLVFININTRYAILDLISDR
jgi:murein L,D-transpeptidase YafK